MNQRDDTAQPWADLDPGSGSAVIVPFPVRARVRATPAPASGPVAVDRYRDSMDALRTACAELALMLEAVSASARSLERSCRSFDEQLQAIGNYGGSIVASSGALTATIKRFRKQLIEAVVSDA
jgi:hypothetical protein